MYTKGGTRKTAYREFMDSVTEPEGVMHYKNLFGVSCLLCEPVFVFSE